MKPIIRPIKDSDFPAILSIYTYYVTETTISFEEEVPTLSDFSKRINHMQRKYPVLVAEVADEIIGYAYAHAFREFSAYDKCAEMTIYLKKDLSSKGIGSQLYQELERLLRQQGIVKLLACITADNQISRSFHEKQDYYFIAEFKKIGYKFETWLDVIWLEKELN